MDLTFLPMPGALRLRPLYPLIDGDGSCSLIYDLERAAVLEVPVEFQFHLAPALETGDLDEDLLGWLVTEGLLTSDGSLGFRDNLETGGMGEGELRVPVGALLRCDGEIHGWIDQGGERAAVEALDLAFRRGLGASRVKLHLDWVGQFPGHAMLEQILVEGCRRGALSGQEVSYELALDASQVTPDVARCLADYPVHVRLRCGERGSQALACEPQDSQPWVAAAPAVRLLLPHGSDQLTLQCVLEGPAHLRDLWSWAKRNGLRSLDVIRLEEPETRHLTLLARVREFRDDLLAIGDEMCATLRASALPVDFQPLTRIVRRLMRSEPGGGYGEGSGGLGWTPGDLLFRSGLDSLDPRLLPELLLLREPVEAVADPLDDDETDAAAFPCGGCWARNVCSHSAFVASPLGGEDPREPSAERCSFWRAEVEAALRFYHRLAQTDPIQVLRLFEEPTGLPVEGFAMRDPIWSTKPS